MYIYACKYPNHSEGGWYYYVGQSIKSPENSKTYFGSGVFCQNYEKKYGKEFTQKNVKKIILMSNIPNREALCYWEQVHIRSYRQQYGNKVMNKADGGEGFKGSHTEESKKKISEAHRGEKHRCYDHKIHSFRNIATGQTFKGTRYNFTKKYNADKSNISKLIHGKVERYNNWVMESCKIRTISELSNTRKGPNSPKYDVNSVRQIWARAYEAGDVKFVYQTFCKILKSPEHPKHKKFIELRDKYIIKKG